jgi:hypothetical protein
MTHEEIIALAKEAGLPYLPTPNSALVRIVTKAVLIEREACAQVADATFRGKPGQSVNLAVANAIRQRGAA